MVMVISRGAFADIVISHLMRPVESTMLWLVGSACNRTFFNHTGDSSGQRPRTATGTATGDATKSWYVPYSHLVD